MLPLDYTVRLEMFEGPLDLLLYLIRRAEVEIADIPIAQITEQYLKFIEQFEIDAPAVSAGDAVSGSVAASGHPARRPLDIERAGEFLVMAATLMEIKSRMLTPVVAAHASGDASAHGADGTGSDGETAGHTRTRGGPPIDPRAELIHQLLEYKRFRDATQRLEEYRDEFFAQFPAAAAPLMEAKPDASDAAHKRGLNGEGPDPEQEGQALHEGQALIDLEDTSIVDLVEAFARIMQSVDFSRVGEHRVVFDDTPIELHAEDILLRLRERLVAGAGAAEGASGEATSDIDGLLPGEMEFVSIFKGRTRSEAIGLFLALLELVKQQKVSVRQDQLSPQADAPNPSGSRIILALIEPPDASASITENSAQAAVPGPETATGTADDHPRSHAEPGSVAHHAL